MVKGEHDVHAVLIESLVTHECRTQTPRTDENGITGIVPAQKMLQLLVKFLGHIPDFRTARRSGQSQILADKRGIYVQCVTQLSTRHIFLLLLRQTQQYLTIGRQSSERRFRNAFNGFLGFTHCYRSPSCHSTAFQ
jgi:hypothetical protein